MKKVPIIVTAVVGVVLAATLLSLFNMSNHGPKFKDVAYLATPRITEKPNAKMLVVEATGDPKTTVGPAFGLLFKTWFKIKDPKKGKMTEAPRARWPKSFDTPRNEWVGMYAMPAPTFVQSVPQVTSKEGLRVELKEWSYGTVAEILHVGAYTSEDTTVQKLLRFIAGSGYEICGDHEEEYLKGPGMLPTNPDKYLTIIRHRVKKVPE